MGGTELATVLSVVVGTSGVPVGLAKTDGNRQGYWHGWVAEEGLVTFSTHYLAQGYIALEEREHLRFNCRDLSTKSTLLSSWSLSVCGEETWSSARQ
jgi:hypothetical protein